MTDNSSEESKISEYSLESSQQNQSEVKDTGSNTETTGPTDKVREKASEKSESEDKSNDPA